MSLDRDNEIKKFIEDLKTLYENYWKANNEINTSVKLSLTISVNNKDNFNISNFEKILSNIDLIYNFHILTFNNKNNIYKITFNGTPDNFLKIMSEKNYKFDTRNQIWVLK